ncbi:MAG: ion transporter [Eubacteriales bacterium]|nr:ion transporter [Eubacteriales bacterium]
MRAKLKNFIERSWFQNIILALVIVNSLSLGIQTFSLPADIARVMSVLDTACLAVFVVEIVLKLIAYGWRFFTDGWNIFDFLVVGVALIPNMGVFAALRIIRVLRVLRSLRALRLVSRLEKLRIIVQAILDSLPSIAWTGFLLAIIFYIFAVVGTMMFGKEFPDWFGNLWKSLYTLFQVMTMESWSMGIARPVIAAFGWAWAYFVPFILISAFVVMNVVVGVVVNTIGEVTEKSRAEVQLRKQGAPQLHEELEKLQEQLKTVQLLLDQQAKAAEKKVE